MNKSWQRAQGAEFAGIGPRATSFALLVGGKNRIWDTNSRRLCVSVGNFISAQNPAFSLMP
jgi:hypothetical protein